MLLDEVPREEDIVKCLGDPTANHGAAFPILLIGTSPIDLSEPRQALSPATRVVIQEAISRVSEGL